MKNFFTEWDRLKEKISNVLLMLFLDYDGTLTPIAPTPDQAILSNTTRTLLEKLSKISQYKLTIISGRALSDIKSLVPLKNINYVGNHGFEIEGSGIKFDGLISTRFHQTFGRLKEAMKEKLCALDGVFIEDKGLTFSLHYRLLPEEEISSFRKNFKKIVEPYLSRKEIRVDSGKKVFEIKPPIDWDKGKAVLWLLKKQQFLAGKDTEILPVAIGDDLTDEDAFWALKNKGITICVGECKESHAQYSLQDSDEVNKLLQKIYELKKEKIT